MQTLIKELIFPTKFRNPPAAIKWGIDCEPKATAHYLELQDNTGISVEECGLFIYPVHCYLGATPDRLVRDPTSFPPEGVLEVKCPWKFRDQTVADACLHSSFCCKLESGCPKLKHLMHTITKYKAKWK